MRTRGYDLLEPRFEPLLDDVDDGEGVQPVVDQSINKTTRTTWGQRKQHPIRTTIHHAPIQIITRSGLQYFPMWRGTASCLPVLTYF